MLAEENRSSERWQYMVFGIGLVKVKRREGVSDSLCSAHTGHRFLSSGSVTLKHNKEIRLGVYYYPQLVRISQLETHPRLHNTLQNFLCL